MIKAVKTFTERAIMKLQ